MAVQEVIENALKNVSKASTTVNGCGRTDAHVHASQYIFHADIEEGQAVDLLFRLNHALPPDIAVFEIIPVHDNAHARFDAVSRTYDYFIHTNKDPFLNGASALYAEKKLDLDSMRAAVALLTRYDDYYAFCKSPDSNKHTVCRVSAATLWADAPVERLHFQITSNRFLRGMIRILVGRILEIGKGRMSVETFEQHLRDKQTPKIITGAHPQGLYLSKVVYPYLELPQRAVFPTLLEATL